MQIQNNYNKYAGGNYSAGNYLKSHTHPGQEGLYETGSGPEREDAGTVKRRDLPGTGALQESGPDPGRKEDPAPERGAGGLRKVSGMLRQAWEAMGDENEQAGGTPSSAGEKNQGAVFAVLSAPGQFFSRYVAEPLGKVRDRVKAGAGAAFQRFEKRRDAFSALADPKSHFSGKREKQGRSGKTQRAGTGRRRPEILTALESDSHLMDSYSRSGTYCRLNENLSRRQERRDANRRAFSEGEEQKTDFAGKTAGNSSRDALGREERLDKRL